MPSGSNRLYDLNVIHGLIEAAVGSTLRRPVTSVGERQDAYPHVPWQ